MLNEKSHSIELEKTIITYIKLSIGPQHTKKLEGMLFDLTQAQEESKSFSLHCEAKHINYGTIDFNISILTTSYWPKYQTSEISIPKELESCISTFKKYY